MEAEALTGTWLENDTSLAPPPFMVAGNTATPIEAHSLELVFEIDPSQQSALGHARLRFTIPQAGRPLLDLVPRAAQLSLDGQQLDPEKLRLVIPPDENTPLRMVDQHLEPGEHTLEITHPLRDATVQFVNGGARLGLFMTDLDPRGYLESHAPANLEFDQLELSMEVHISGATGAHQLFTNGRSEQSGNTWRISFPDYFNCASCYLHLTNRAMHVREASFNGAERQIPIKAYGEALAEVEQALAHASDVLRELEQTYGPYTHDSLLIYCTGNINGGMEYAGATMTSLEALGHEVTHSWFARGVMPANGNAGWIDEAIARWRDFGYPRAPSLPVRPPVNLAGFSPYRRHTPSESYAMGSLLLSELDQMFSAGGGLRPVLARLFQEKQRQLISTSFFQTFLEETTGISLGPIFDRYVYGKSDGTEHPHEIDEIAATHIAVMTEEILSPPPRAFTNAELRALL